MNSNNPISTNVQRLLNVFVFFLPLGFIKIAGISFTFYIFIAIVFLIKKRGFKLIKFEEYIDYIFAFFVFLLALSIVFSEDTYRTVDFIKDFKVFVRLFYWFTLALFIKTWANRINFYQLSKYFFLGTIVLIIFYFTIGKPLEMMPQNSFAYLLVILIPFSMYSIFRRSPFIITVFIAILLLYFAFISESRSGALIVLLQITTLLVTANYIPKKFLFFIAFTFSPIIIFLILSFNQYKYDLAEFIKPYNEDIAILIVDYEKIKQEDESWLERQQMIKKGLIIFEEHPFLGIGFGHFKYYWVEMPIISYYLTEDISHYNKLSAHNTYIQILAGAGIFAFISFIFILFLIVKNGIPILLSFKFNSKIFIFSSFLGMIIYFYVIAQAMGAITWFTLGYGMSLVKTKKEKNKKIKKYSRRFLTFVPNRFKKDII